MEKTQKIGDFINTKLLDEINITVRMTRAAISCQWKELITLSRNPLDEAERTQQANKIKEKLIKANSLLLESHAAINELYNYIEL